MGNRCIKSVDVLFCRNCTGVLLKHGKVKRGQRYRCKTCLKTQMAVYRNIACCPRINKEIAAHITAGCGIRSTARLLHIAANTVLSRILVIAQGIQKPAIATGRTYEVDELRTYVKTRRMNIG